MPSRRASSSDAVTEWGVSAVSPSSGSRPMNRGVWNKLLGRATRQGAVDRDSAPPAITTLASPSATARMPSRIASRPEAHWRSTVRRGNAVPQSRGKADDAGGVAARRGVAEDDLVDRRGLELRVLRARPAPRAPPGSRCAGSCAGRRAGRARSGAQQRCMQVPAPWPRSWGTHPHWSTSSEAPRPACRWEWLMPVTPQEHGEIPPSGGLGGWRSHARVL